MLYKQFLAGMKDKAEKEAFAKRVGVTHLYSLQVAAGSRPPGRSLCERIERASEGQVTKHDLRPDLYPASAPRADLVAIPPGFVLVPIEEMRRLVERKAETV